MERIHQLFYGLIRTSIASSSPQQVPFSELDANYIPSQEEWQMLYELAGQQGLIGICFYGVQRIYNDKPAQAANLPCALRMQWLAMAASVQRRNELLNNRCLQLQQMFTDGGFKSCILKGQGIATLYGKDLSALRQSGDIDIWVDAPREIIIRCTKDTFKLKDFDYKHLHAEIFRDVSVEIHYLPSISRRPWANRQLKRFIAKHQDWNETTEVGGKQLHIPSREFNLVFILQHIFTHLFGSETTIKQYLDYYFVLQDAYKHGCNLHEAYLTMSQLGMSTFARGVMWLMHEIFNLSPQCMICEPDAKEGSFLLNRLMNNTYEHAGSKHGSLRWKLSTAKLQTIKNLNLITHYPLEVIMLPTWLVWHFVWKRLWAWRHGFIRYAKA